METVKFFCDSFFSFVRIFTDSNKLFQVIGFFGNVVVCIIMIVASIDTLGSFLISRGYISRHGSIGRIFCNRSEEELLESVLKRLGFTKSEIQTMSSHKATDRKHVKNKMVKLIHLLSRYLYRFSDGLTYGTGLIKSDYYINTMEASHKKEDLNLMCSLIDELITKDANKKYPDFIITPKSGNVILGKSFADKNNIIALIAKGNKDKSRARYNIDDIIERKELLLINYEGSYQLLEKINNINENEKLYGVMIDCNASTGTDIITTMEDFNACIENTYASISKVTEAYILFRPDNNVDADKIFADKEYKVHRYFDLTEEMKGKLYNLGKENLIDINIEKGKNAVIDFIQLLCKNNLLKADCDCKGKQFSSIGTNTNANM